MFYRRGEREFAWNSTNRPARFEVFRSVAVTKRSEKLAFLLQRNQNGKWCEGSLLESAVASCKVMHGQYDLHVHSISACGIAWGLHCKPSRIYI